MSPFREQADWLTLLEAAYAPAGDEWTWADGVLAACREVFAPGSILTFFGVEISPDLGQVVPRFSSGAFGLDAVEQNVAAFRPFGQAAVRAIYLPPSLVTTHARVERFLPEGARRLLAGQRQFLGVADVLGLVLQPAPGFTAVACGSMASKAALSNHELQRLTRVALHLEAGLRLLRRPQVVKAILEPSGRVVHLEEGAPEVTLLSALARRVDGARTRKRRREPESLELWTALAEGQVSLVERMDGPRRYYWVMENAPERQRMRALTNTERNVVAESARGLSAKLVGYGLGLSAPLVSKQLASAASKVGLASRTELVRLAAMLCRDPHARLPDAALTRAEQEIVELLRRGLSNGEIAAIRNRSVSTIANQVAALLRKTGSPTRRALVAKV
jgi:DNA-binding CsgD family transcriptional regulator